MKLLRFLLPALCLASCSSVFNGDTHRVTIRTNVATDSIQVGAQNLRLRNGEASVKVKRSEDSLKIWLPAKDSTYTLQLRSKNSFNYTMGAILTAGLSTIVDRDNPKRYFYQKNMYIRKDENGIAVFRFPPLPRGSIRVHLSFPYLNYFYISTNTSHKNNFGFLGLATGVDYYYKQNQFVSLQLGGAMDNAVGFPVGVDYFGVHEQTNCVFVNVTHNHTAGSFEFGYGINGTGYRWYRTDTANRGIGEEKNNTALGFNLNSNYRITKNFHVGLLYQPSVFTIDNGLKPDYQHLLSAELIFKFSTKKPRR